MKAARSVNLSTLVPFHGDMWLPSLTDVVSLLRLSTDRQVQDDEKYAYKLMISLLHCSTKTHSVVRSCEALPLVVESSSSGDNLDKLGGNTGLTGTIVFECQLVNHFTSVL